MIIRKTDDFIKGLEKLPSEIKSKKNLIKTKIVRLWAIFYFPCPSPKIGLP